MQHALHEREVHIWLVKLDESISAEAESALSPDEKARAQRFHFEKHCRRYMAARYALRRILSYYIPYQPAAIQFEYGSHGKPHLAETQNQQALQFNVSHSKDIAVYALTRQAEIGIDVETINPKRNTIGIAKRYFSPAEIVQLEKLPASEQAYAFFQIWCQKEAFIKALGLGLAFPLKDFSVDAKGEGGLLACRDPAYPPADWTLNTFTPTPDCCAAFATPQPVTALSFH